MTQICILGCGWLGFPLAQALVKDGFQIKGSNRTNAKKELLESVGIMHYAIQLETESAPNGILDFLTGSEILIIAVPPGLSRKNKDFLSEDKNVFVKKIQNLIAFIEQSSIQKIVFISSTSVYADAENNPILTEDSFLNPATESGKQLLEIEDLLMKNKHFKTAVLRFGGLIGQDRNPARFLAGKLNVANPDGAINLIHLDDCIGIIKAIIAKDIWNERFNAVAPYHPTRKEYYSQKALDQNLVPPAFNLQVQSIGKVISSDKLVAKLAYVFSQLKL